MPSLSCHHGGPQARYVGPPGLPYLGAIQMYLRVDIPHPQGTVPTVASPMRFSVTPVEYDLPLPLLGQHTREVLSGVLGLGGAELDALQQRGFT